MSLIKIKNNFTIELSSMDAENYSSIKYEYFCFIQLHFILEVFDSAVFKYLLQLKRSTAKYMLYIRFLYTNIATLCV